MNRKYGSVVDRLLANSFYDYISGCWLWIGHRSKKGYGQINFRENGRHVKKYAHRVSYETYIGSIPPDMEIDHVCENEACIHPNHMRLVTKTENLTLRDFRKKWCGISNCTYPSHKKYKN